MNWGQSYTATWRVFRVNRQTWADGDMLSNIDSANLSRTADGKLLESGGFSLTGEFESDYYRIVMTAEQGGLIERVEVATLLFEVDGGTVDYGTVESTVDGHSVLYPAYTTSIITGEYAPAGADGVLYVRNLLQNTIHAPIQTEGSFTLNDHLVFELGASVIEAVWTVLDAMDYIIQIDGHGTVHIRPKPTTPSLILDGANTGIISNGIDFSASMSEIPNRYIVMDDGIVTTAINNSDSSPVSTVNRGYTVDVIDTAPTPTNGETLSEYASRRLHQLSVLRDERSYTREFAPDLYPYSLISASIDGLFGDYRVVSQSITCDNGITVSERSAKETALW